MGVWIPIRQIVRLLPPSTANRFDLGSSRHFSSRISSKLSFQYGPNCLAGRRPRDLAEQRTLGDQGPGDEGIQPPGLVRRRWTPDKIDTLRKGTFETVWNPKLPGAWPVFATYSVDMETLAEIRDLAGSSKGPQTLHWRVRELDSADVKQQMMLGGDELERIKYRGLVLEVGRAGSGQYPVKVQNRSLRSCTSLSSRFVKALERAFASLPSTSQARRLAAVEERKLQIEARLSRYKGSNLSQDAGAAFRGHISLRLGVPRETSLRFNQGFFTGHMRLFRTRKFDHEPLLRQVGLQGSQREGTGLIALPPIPARLVVPEDASDKPNNGLLDFSRRTLATQASVIQCEERMQLEVLTLDGEWVSSSLSIHVYTTDEEQDGFPSPRLRNIARNLAGMPPLDKQLPPGVKATLSRVGEYRHQSGPISGDLYINFPNQQRTYLRLSPEMMKTLFGHWTWRNLDDMDDTLEWVSNISICDDSRHLKFWVRRCDGSQWHEYRPYLNTKAGVARWHKKQDFTWTQMKAQQEEYEADGGYKYPRLVLDANGLPDRWIEE